MASSRAYLLFVSGPQQGRHEKLHGREMIVGRAAECHITLAEEFVSRQHMKFSPTYEGWVVESLSAAGTYVNGKRFKPGKQVLLGTGDVVGIGREIEMLFVAPGDDPAVALTAYRQAHPLPAEAAHEPSPAPSKPEAPAPASPAPAAKEPASAIPQEDPRRRKRRKYLIAGGIYAAVLAAVAIVLATVSGGNTPGQTADRPKILSADDIRNILTVPLEAPPSATAHPAAAAQMLQAALVAYDNRASGASRRYECLRDFEKYRAINKTVDQWENNKKYQIVQKEVIDEVAAIYEAARFLEDARQWEKSRRAWEKLYQVFTAEDDRNSAVYKGLVKNVLDHMSYVSSRTKSRQ